MNKEEMSSQIMKVLGWKVLANGASYERTAKSTPLQDAYAIFDFMEKRIEEERLKAQIHEAQGFYNNDERLNEIVKERVAKLKAKLKELADPLTIERKE